MNIKSPSISKLDNVLRPLAESRTVTLAYGIGSAVIGLAVLFWPNETLRVVAVLFAVQLIAASIFRFVVSFVTNGDSIVHRLQLAALASFALIVGIVLLEDVYLSLRLMTIVLGIYWAINGVIELVEAVSYSGRTDSTWVVVSGTMGLVVGLILIAAGAFPDAFQGLQERFLLVARTLGVWLVLFGLISVVRALRDRAPSRSVGAASST